MAPVIRIISTINRWPPNNYNSNNYNKINRIVHQLSKCFNHFNVNLTELLNTLSNHLFSNSNNTTKHQQVPDVQSQKQKSLQNLPKPTPQYHHRPERPKTLDTQSSLHAPINSNQIKTPVSEDELRSENLRSGRISDSSVNSRLSVPNATVLAQKLSSGSSDMQFDEQEEWKKISEIMANFGSDLINDSSINTNVNRRRDYQNRGENGRSNSIAGFTFSEIDRHRKTMKSSESMNSNVQRRSGSQSPNSLLMNFLYDNELDELSNVLYDNGYDDIDFIKGILDESDLETMDVKAELRKKLMTAIENDLQKPARAITPFNKCLDESKTNAYHSMDTNHDKQPNSIDNDIGGTFNHNNNSYSTIPKQKCLNSDETNGMLTVNDWLASIRLSHYAEIFR